MNIDATPWDKFVILLSRTKTTIFVVFVCTQLDTSPILPVLAWGVINKACIASMHRHRATVVE